MTTEVVKKTDPSHFYGNAVFILTCNAVGNEYDIDPTLLLAMCEVESSYNMHAIRYESHYSWLYDPVLKRPHKSTHLYPHSPITKSRCPTEKLNQKQSWGALQVMGAVAREYGFEGWFPELCGRLGIEYGAKHLQRYYRRHHDWEDAVSSYNQGSPRKLADGKYRNQNYVDKVYKIYERLKS